MKRCLFHLIFLFTTCLAGAQRVTRYNALRFNVNEGLLQSTMSDMAFDKNNFCWISFPNGIQKFDGKNFVNVPIQPGLPDDKFVSFLQLPNENLLLSHSKGISLYDIAANKFRHVYQHPPGTKRPAAFLGVDDNIAYFISDRTIIGLDLVSFRELKKIKLDLPDYATASDDRIRVSDRIVQHRVAFMIRSVIYLWDLKANRPVGQTDYINLLSTHFLHLASASEIVYHTNERLSELVHYNIETRETKYQVVFTGNDRAIGRCNFVYWQGQPIVTVNNFIYEADPGFATLHTEILNYQNKPIPGTATIWSAKEDKLGNLFILTVTAGFVKVFRNNYQLRYYGTPNREDNNVVSVLPDKQQNRVLIGCTLNGLLIFDTSQNLIKHIPRLPGPKPAVSVNTILKDGSGGYYLFATSSTNVWHLSASLDNLSRIPVVATTDSGHVGIDYFAHPLFYDQHRTLVQSQGNIYQVNKNAKQVQQYNFTTSYTMAGLFDKDKVVTHANDELLFLDTINFEVRQRKSFPNTGYARCIIQGYDNDYYIGTNNGIFRIDKNGTILDHWTRKNGLPDDCIYSMALDNNDGVWCSSNKGLFRLRNENVFQLKKEDGLQENEFNTNVVARAADGELYFGGVNGVTSFFPHRIGNKSDPVHVIFTDIRANNQTVATDTAAWNIHRITLPYTRSSLSFDFMTVASNSPDQYIYQYQMVGFDDQWIQADGLQTVRYALPPGKYRFRIYASRLYDTAPYPMQEIVIWIRPPFWNTWWFRTLLALLLVGCSVVVINYRARKKYRKQLRILEGEQEIKMERERISRDLHDSLGAYANAVLYNTGQLEQERDENKKKELMKDLKFASRDIILSLRETIWALGQEQYTASECLLRIRNFIQPLARSYSHIHFSVEGDAPPGLVLHNTRALNLVRIVQEAVTNGIKHAGASTIDIRNRMEDGKWKLEISDNGKGFQYETQLHHASGNGLQNIQQRAKESGFELTVTTAHQQGTSISIII